MFFVFIIRCSFLVFRFRFLYFVFRVRFSFFVFRDLIYLTEIICCKGAYSEVEARDIVMQLVDGMTNLHNRGITHRDLKVTFPPLHFSHYSPNCLLILNSQKIFCVVKHQKDW
jgi:serine/threonine protein kinase